MYLLLNANFVDTKMLYNGEEILIQKGSFPTGRKKLAAALKCDESSTYKRLKKLEKLKFCNIKSNNQFSIITVVNWDMYQSKCDEGNNDSNNKVTTEEQRSNNGVTQHNKYNNNKKNNNINTLCPEQCPDPQQIFIKLILNNKSYHHVTIPEIEKWKELYPAVDIEQQLRSMSGWLESNISKRKTKAGINRFINSWLSREQDKGQRTTRPTTNYSKPKSTDSNQHILDQIGDEYFT